MNAVEAKELKPGDLVRVIGTRTMDASVMGKVLVVEQVLHGGSFVVCSCDLRGLYHRGAVDCRDIEREGVRK